MSHCDQFFPSVRIRNFVRGSTGERKAKYRSQIFLGRRHQIRPRGSSRGAATPRKHRRLSTSTWNLPVANQRAAQFYIEINLGPYREVLIVIRGRPVGACSKDSLLQPGEGWSWPAYWRENALFGKRVHRPGNPDADHHKQQERPQDVLDPVLWLASSQKTKRD